MSETKDTEEQVPKRFSKVKSDVVDPEVKSVEEKKKGERGDPDYMPLGRNGVAFEVSMLLIYLAIAGIVMLSPSLKSTTLSLTMCIATLLFLLPAFPAIFSIAGLRKMPRGFEYAEGRVFYFTKNNLTVIVLIHFVIVGFMAWFSLRGIPVGF